MNSSRFSTLFWRDVKFTEVIYILNCQIYDVSKLFFFNMSDKRKYVALTANLPNWIKWITGGMASAVAEVFFFEYLLLVLDNPHRHRCKSKVTFNVI
jgi:hypothetical protein